MIIRNMLTGVAFLLASTTTVFAQEMDHSAHHGTMATEQKADDSPSTKAFIAANSKMHEGMTIDFTGNADVDFVRGMIAHHQGAIDMARIELEHGKDPAIRKLAEEIIKAQEGEIDMMKTWLEKNGK